MITIRSLMPEIGPAWSAPTQDGAVGQDYLGTIQTNLNMLRELTGIFNTQIRSARQHAILAWAAARFLKNHKEVTAEAFQQFLELVETVQLYGQTTIGDEVGGGTGGLGTDSTKHLPASGPLPTAFSAYKRSPANTSAMAAVQYGPSSKRDGFGFLVMHNGIPVPTARGERLAAALDPLLRDCSAYPILTRPQVPSTIARSDAEALARSGLVIVGRDGQPRPERGAYIDALFNFDGRDSQDRRSDTVALILHAVEEMDDGEGVTPHDVRAAMLAWSPEEHPLPTHLVGTAHRWQVLQLRQLQRYALEALMAIAERWMAVRALGLHEMQQQMDRACKASAVWGGTAQASLASVPEPLRWAEARTPWSLLWDTIHPNLRSRGTLEAALQGTVSLLIGVQAMQHHLDGALKPSRFLEAGGRTRISLQTFSDWWRRRGPWPLRDVVTELLEEFVLQQHVAIAVSRYDNEKRRLRFSNDEQGWVLLPGTKPMTPKLTSDRLVAMMALLDDLALLSVHPGDYRGEPRYQLTETGRAAAARFAAQSGP